MEWIEKTRAEEQGHLILIHVVRGELAEKEHLSERRPKSLSWKCVCACTCDDFLQCVPFSIIFKEQYLY